MLKMFLSTVLRKIGLSRDTYIYLENSGPYSNTEGKFDVVTKNIVLYQTLIKSLIK